MSHNYARRERRRSNAIHRLLRQGVIIHEDERQLDVPWDSSEALKLEVGRFKRTYRFKVQFYFG